MCLNQVTVIRPAIFKLNCVKQFICNLNNCYSLCFLQGYKCGCLWGVRSTRKTGLKSLRQPLNDINSRLKSSIPWAWETLPPDCWQSQLVNKLLCLGCGWGWYSMQVAISSEAYSPVSQTGFQIWLSTEQQPRKLPEFPEWWWLHYHPCPGVLAYTTPETQ